MKGYLDPVYDLTLLRARTSRAQRNLREILMSGVEDVVTAASSQELAEAQSVLVGEVRPSEPVRHQAARSLPVISSKRMASSTCSGVRS